MTTTTGAGAPPILTSPWPDPAVPAISLPEGLLATAAESPGRPAIIDAAGGGRSATRSWPMGCSG